MNDMKKIYEYHKKNNKEFMSYSSTITIGGKEISVGIKMTDKLIKQFIDTENGFDKFLDRYMLHTKMQLKRSVLKYIEENKDE